MSYCEWGVASSEGTAVSWPDDVSAHVELILIIDYQYVAGFEKAICMFIIESNVNGTYGFFSVIH